MDCRMKGYPGLGEFKDDYFPLYKKFMDISFHNTEYSARINFFDSDDITVAKYFLRDKSVKDIVDLLEKHGFPPSEEILEELEFFYLLEEDDDSYADDNEV